MIANGGQHHRNDHQFTFVLMELMVGIKHKPSIKSLHTFLKFGSQGCLLEGGCLIKREELIKKLLTVERRGSIYLRGVLGLGLRGWLLMWGRVLTRV